MKNVILYISERCMEFMVGHTSDSMTTLEYNFHRWVNAWCLSLPEPILAQLLFFFSLALAVCELRAIFFVSSQYFYKLDC